MGVLRVNKVSDLCLIYPLDCQYVAEIRSRYAGWSWNLSHGYIRYARGNRVILEHRAVAELVHGLDAAGLHVHHIDRNPRNNDALNLVCLTVQQHNLLHTKAGGDLLTWCNHCGSEIYKTRSRFDRSPNHYCSASCTHAAARLRPDRHVVLDALRLYGNFCAAGRHFGVSDNAVRNWAKYYEIDISNIDGRRNHGPNFLQRASERNGHE